MARIDLPEPDDIEGPHADAVRASKERWGWVGNIERAFAIWPELTTAEHDLTEVIMVHGELSPALKEAIGVVVSQVNACPYCYTHHTYQMDKAGRSEADQHAINALEFDALDDPQDRTALAFAERVARDANRVTDGDFEALREAGFDDREILEIVLVIGLFMFYNTFTTTLGLEIDDPVVDYRMD